MDAIQKEFECCGVTSIDDWNKSARKQDVPKSCCKPSEATCEKRTYVDASTTFRIQYHPKVGVG